MKEKRKQLLAALWMTAVLLGCAGCRQTRQEAVWNEADSVTEESVPGPEESAAISAEGTAAQAEGTAAQPEGAATQAEGTAAQPEGTAAPAEDAAISAEGMAAPADGESVPEAAQEDIPVRERPKVRGIYVTGAMAGTANVDNLIDLVDRTELNALVIDIKNDEGYVVCDMEVPLVQEIGSVKRYVRDMPELIRKCKEKGIYLIARIVAFKDPFLAEARPEWSLHNADGTIFRDKDGLAWVNPYEEQVWKYLADIAEGAVALGFDEVQFDYIRFSTDRGMSQVDFGIDVQEKPKEEAITEFAAYAAQRIHEKGAAVSADVYGVVIDSAQDQQIVGQDYLELAQHLDYLSPMVYPSHYGPNNYNIPIPDAQPYDTVLAAMQASKKVLSGVMKVEMQEEPAQDQGAAPESSVSGNEIAAGQDTVSGNSAAAGQASVSGNEIAADQDSVSGNSAAAGEDTVSGNDIAAEAEHELTQEEIAALVPLETVRADVRPWLQDFTASWVKGHISYGPEQIRDQIQAVYDAGYEEWILWNAANRYTEDGLEEEAQDGQEEQETEEGPREQQGGA